MSFAVSTVAIVGLAIAAGAGTAKAIDGAIEAKKAKADEAKAKIEVAKNKNMFANLDTSNPYQNLENTMEDLTVNQQEAEFQKQQSMQNQANIMQQMRGAAGGSGIAALAQTMAQQGSIDAQRAAASIGKQEAANQQAAAAEASRIQAMERKGELISREQEFGKIQSQLQMSADELAEARKRKQEAKDQVVEGVSDIGEAGMDYAGTMGG
tara:strand:- start:500 stop:1129 length:630 start_codon:yes stop_codon:yes gene_type:complete